MGSLDKTNPVRIGLKTEFLVVFESVMLHIRHFTLAHHNAESEGLQDKIKASILSPESHLYAEKRLSG